jgi:integrase
VPKKAVELGPLAVSRLVKPGFYFVGGVAGLALQVQPSGGRSWILRATVGGKRRDMGLGGYPDVTLAAAREAAREARLKTSAGVDPIANRAAARTLLKLERAKAVTFDTAATAYIEAHESSWRNAKHTQQWRNSLSTYASPVIGKMLVRDIDLPHILQVLEPIWQKKTETASRVRSRMESVLGWATVRGYRQGLNPARWKDHLDNLLPAPGKIAKERHHPALAIAEAGAFMDSLRGHGGNGARALEFLVLTAARSGEARGARWSEMNLAEAVWTIPAERMKMEKEHRVPLSPRAIEVLEAAVRQPDNDLVFPAPRGKELSDGTLNAIIRRMNESQARWVDPKDGRSAVAHGFRSTFRDWVSERTNYPRDVAEMALAHSIGDKVEAAYRRGELFEKRRSMMNKWAAFLAKPETSAKVVALAKRA